MGTILKQQFGCQSHSCQAIIKCLSANSVWLKYLTIVRKWLKLTKFISAKQLTNLMNLILWSEGTFECDGIGTTFKWLIKACEAATFVVA